MATGANSSASMVVYYSLRHNTVAHETTMGRTQQVAEVIGKVTNSPVYELQNQRPYLTNYDDIVAQADGERTNPPPLLADVDISSYDTIYLGSPVWWSTYPSLFTTWFKQHDFSGKTIYVFVTHMGSGFGDVVTDLQKALPQATVKPLIAISNLYSLVSHEEVIREAIEHAQ